MLNSVACSILNITVTMSDLSVMLNLMNEKKHHLQEYTMLYKDKANEIFKNIACSYWVMHVFHSPACLYFDR